ncbi:MAG: N-acetylmuramoyl-L-alanine amidase [Microcoleus sp. PH2017_01_SCD_O_A]|uniref:N-acetylmuramoyl-L-alanine amidase n=1 Tax=unclassified Microcoleus TaxID=2642155 RepID=UPI001D8BECE1|nr:MULTISPECIES: N-acetylmuramoyl-L-alanine amidase [unclassified Microcoleus]MCC3503260.1 N-acetylmuramoyl-L-alanine amidase [Microcoleus sp. PH2017_19_SFW_U_A]TAF90230.1 MAG: N-acetylmuramoyl-L-alanine amidase [Oscillatoriales cyanobacterium]MCC3425899.1 N-acetylmuramoyl-L-alanine amidase [Microcoleus sp. PH2017_01_SCD_O_A]MCC3447922.1 N-acetylmuramoyl-L-alanine amidase [Microcoleus sp. PH2017_09_SFU_O_A]MCC3522429.1 N-acetylmuramoyl-L-alanine amidase [Microcoleus sp. PH2017_20_SFW_D_A]
MKFHWLLPSFLSVFLLAGAAEAARLQSWRFDASENRLYIRTEGGVQPKAQLIFNPTRLVIDLPGTSLGSPSVNKPLSGAIESVRVGQFDDDTTRIVVELKDGFTLDPQQVKFRGISASEWTVDLPAPVRGGTQNSISEPGGERLSVEPSARETQSAEATVVQNVQVTADGFLIRTAGGNPQINFQQSRAGDIATLDIEGATLAPGAGGQQPQTNGKHGVDKIEVRQLPTDPPVTRVTLRMKSSNTQWRASVGNSGSVVLSPGGTSPPILTRSQPLTVGRPAQGSLARVQSIDLASNGTQFVVRTDRQVSYTSGWDQSSKAYWIRLASSSLAGQIPQLDGNSPVSFTASQEDAETVVIWVQPRSGVQVGRVTRPNPQMLSLQLRSSASAQSPLTRDPNPQPLPPRSSIGAGDLPQGSNRRFVVAIDPGHGGRDPGAVGIGGIQEKEIVLDISYQVARLLEQQGVQAVMTRTDDSEIDLEPRVSLASRVNATLFVSIHANAINMSRPDISGIETYYFDSGEDLARVIHASILDGTGAKDRRVRQARFYVLRKSAMPSVLLEVGFVTGAEDAAKLSDPAYRSQMAASIARGILYYLQQR